MSQRALGRRLRIDKSPMVGLVDDLERLGLAERRRSDATAACRRSTSRPGPPRPAARHAAGRRGQRAHVRRARRRRARGPARPPAARRRGDARARLTATPGCRRPARRRRSAATRARCRRRRRRRSRRIDQLHSSSAPAHRDQRADDRVAPVVERDERPRHVAAHAQLRDHLGAGDRARMGGAAGQRRPARTARTVKVGGRPCSRRAGRGGGPIGPGASARRSDARRARAPSAAARAGGRRRAGWSSRAAGSPRRRAR